MAGDRRTAVSLLTPLIALLLPVSLLTGCGKAAPRVSMVAVPELAGMTVREAEEALAVAGLEKGATSEAFSDTVAAGRVISTSPARGEQAEEGSRVDLVVSKGPETVSLSDLVGKAENEAVAALQAQGLQVDLQRAYHESIAPGLVCAMDPAPGTPLSKGAVVRLTISRGSAYVTCGTCGGKGRITISAVCPDCRGSGVCYT